MVTDPAVAVDLLAVAEDAADQQRPVLHGAEHGASSPSAAGGGRPSATEQARTADTRTPGLAPGPCAGGGLEGLAGAARAVLGPGRRRRSPSEPPAHPDPVADEEVRDGQGCCGIARFLALMAAVLGGGAPLADRLGLGGVPHDRRGRRPPRQRAATEPAVPAGWVGL